MRVFIVLIALLSSSLAFSADVVSVYGYNQYVGNEFTQPNSAVILYSDGTFELLRKYSSEENTSIQSGHYSLLGDEITMEVTKSTCKMEVEKGALGAFTLKYSENSISYGDVVSYTKKDGMFLRLFDVEKTGCLYSSDE